MITRAEIESMAARLDVHPSHVQRDYVHGWLLSTLYSQSNLAHRLVLKGGNCLRKAYFTNGRYSRDLDFSTATGISSDELGREFNEIGAILKERAGINFDLGRTLVQDKRGADADKVVSEARLYFEDFYGQRASLFLELSSMSLNLTVYICRYGARTSSSLLRCGSVRSNNTLRQVGGSSCNQDEMSSPKTAHRRICMISLIRS